MTSSVTGVGNDVSTWRLPEVTLLNPTTVVLVLTFVKVTTAELAAGNKPKFCKTFDIEGIWFVVIGVTVLSTTKRLFCGTLTTDGDSKKVIKLQHKRLKYSRKY